VSSIDICVAKRLRCKALLTATFLVGVVAVLMPSHAALAACAPSAGAGTPPSGTVVTCSGTTTNQNNPNGYGNGTQNGLTINVQPGATVTAGAGNGLSLNNQNFIGNSGTISTPGGGNAINGNGNLTINNSGSITSNGLFSIRANTGAINLTNSGQVTAPFQGVFTDGPVTVDNTGTITSAGVGFATTIHGSVVDITNAGTIKSSGGIGIASTTGGSKVVNSGAISTPFGSPFASGGPAVMLAGQNNVVTNTASGSITGISNVFAGGTMTVDNAGTITGIPISGIAVGGGALLTLTNSGMINGSGSIGVNAEGTLIGQNSGTILGLTGVIAGANSNFTNSGTITGTVGAALAFTSGSSTLKLTPTSVINGKVITAANSTLQLGGAGTGSFDAGNISKLSGAAQYQGFGLFEKVDSSTWTLTGSNNLALAWTAKAGVLMVTGALPNSPFTVNSGATLGGAGTTGAVTVNAGGALSPGSSIGTITIAGNLTFVGPGTFLVEVSPAAADHANVSGTATLSGTVQISATAGPYRPLRYTILTAANISGTFGSLQVSGDFGSAVKNPHLEYDGGNVFFVLDPNAISPLLAGGTRNQRSVAGAIDTALAAGSQSAPLLALFNLTAAQLPGALDQLSGEVHASTAGVLVDESLYPRSAVLGRLRQASYGSDSSMASLSMGGPQAFAGGEELSTLAYGKSPIVTKAPRMVSQPGYDAVFWAQGFGARGKFDSDGNAMNVRRDLVGFFSGVDTRVGTSGRIGIAAGYTGSKYALDGRGSSNVETGHLMGYGGWRFGALNLRAGGAHAWHSIDTSRTIVFPGFFDNATANYGGRTGQIFGELGYGFAFGNIAVEPFAGAAWVQLKTDAATERGGAAALAVAANSFNVGYSTLGIRAASMIPLGHDMVLVPRASLAWQHAFNDVTPEARLAFIAAPVPFVIAGAPIARDSILGEAGLDLAIGRNTTLGVSYVGQLARNVHDHAGKGKFSWKF
jgi:outer membrane autotransporter protein